MAELIGVEVKVDTTKARSEVKKLESSLTELGVRFAKDEKIQQQTASQLSKTGRSLSQYESLVKKVNKTYLENNQTTKKANETVKKSNEELKKFNSSLLDFAKTNAGALLAVVGLTGGIVALTGGLRDASEATLEFNRGLGQVATLIPGNTERVDELRDALRNLAVEQGATLSDLSSGLFDVVSAFGDSEETVGRLTAVLKASKAGGATASDSLRLLSAVTKAYNDTSAEGIQRASDLAFVTNKLGQTTFTELAGSIGRVASISATLGVRQEELFATASSLTGVVGSASEVFTGLQAVEATLLKPTAELSKLFNQLGVKDGQELIKTNGGLIDSLENLFDATGRNVSELAKALGSVEALKVAVPLLTNQNNKYRDSLRQLESSQGATNEALDASRAGFNETTFTLDKLQAIFRDLAIEIGDRVLPVVGDIASIFIDTTKPANEIREEIRGLVDNLATVAKVGGVAGTVLGANLASSLAGSIGQLSGFKKAFDGLKSAPQIASGIASSFSLLTGPVGVVTVGIVGLVKAYDDLQSGIDQAIAKQDKQTQELEENLNIRIKFFEEEDRLIKQAGLTAEEVARLRSELTKKQFNEKIKLFAEEARAEEELTKKLIAEEELRAKKKAEIVELDLGSAGTFATGGGFGDSNQEEIKQREQNIESLKIQAEAIRLVREQNIGLEEATQKATFAIQGFNDLSKEAIENELALARETDKATQALKDQNDQTKEAEKLRKKLADADDFIKQQEESLKSLDEEKKTKSELLLIDLERIQTSQDFANASEEERQKLQEKIDKLKELIEAEKERDTAEQTRKIAEAGQEYIKTLETETQTIKSNTQAVREKRDELIGEEEAKAILLVTTGKLKDAEEDLKNEILEKARAKDQANQASKEAISLAEEEARKQEELAEKQKAVEQQDKEALATLDEKIKRLKEENEFIENNIDGREKLIALEKAGLEEITEGNIKLAQERLKELDILERKNELLKEGTSLEAEQQKKRQEELKKASDKALSDLEAQSQAIAQTLNAQEKEFTDAETGVSVFLAGDTPIDEVRRILDQIIAEEERAKEEALKTEQEKQEALLKEQQEGKEKAEALEKEKQEKIIELAEFRAEKEQEALEKVKDATEELTGLREKQAEAEQALSDAIDAQRVNSANESLNNTLSILDRISDASSGIGFDSDQGSQGRLQGLRNEIRVLRNEFFRSDDAEEQVELAQELDAKVKERLQLELDIQSEIAEEQRKVAEERIEALKNERDQQLENAQSFRDIATSLRDQVSNLEIGEFSSLTGQQRVGTIQERFRSTVAQAEAGDLQASQALPELANTLLESARETFRSSSAFQDIFSEVKESLESVAVSAESEAGGLEAGAQNLSDEISFREASIKELQEQKDLQAQAVTELQQVRDVLNQNSEVFSQQLETQFQTLATAISETGLRDADIGNLDQRIADRLAEKFGEEFLVDPAQEKIIELEQKRNEALEKANIKNDEIKALLSNIQGIQNQQLTAVPNKLEELKGKNDQLIAEISDLNVTFGQIANQNRADRASGF